MYLFGSSCTINKALRFNIHNTKTLPDITSKIKNVKYVSKIDANFRILDPPNGSSESVVDNFQCAMGQVLLLENAFWFESVTVFFPILDGYLFW